MFHSHYEQELTKDNLFLYGSSVTKKNPLSHTVIQLIFLLIVVFFLILSYLNGDIKEEPTPIGSTTISNM